MRRIELLTGGMTTTPVKTCLANANKKVSRSLRKKARVDRPKALVEAKPHKGLPGKETALSVVY
jgi:hypothetical protein